MSLELASPLGALAGLLALLPLAGALLGERRLAGVRRTLGLAGPRRRLDGALLAVAGTLAALIGLAASQPVVRLEETIAARADAEAFVVLDVSRSMLAAPAADAPTRLERAVRVALDLRERLADVPVGVASMTDRPLPHLFPTPDREAFAGVLERAVGVDRPPPTEERPRATDVGSLAALARENYFSPRTARRLVLLLTDGESRPFDPEQLADVLRQAGVALTVVRLWDPGERIFRPDGSVEQAYRPDASAVGALDALGVHTAPGRVLGEPELEAVEAAARAALGEGPAVELVRQRRALPLAGWLLLAAAVPAAVVVAGGARRGWRVAARS